MDDKEFQEMLNSPAGFQVLLQNVELLSCDSPDYEARATLGHIEYLTERIEALQEKAEEEAIENAINRGSVHRFTGFLNYEP